MADKSFSHNLFKIIFLIAMVPIVSGAVIITMYIQRETVRQKIESAHQTLDTQVKNIQDSTDIFYRIKSTLIADTTLSQFLLKGPGMNTEDITSYLINEAASIEHMAFLYPDLYSIHIFTANPRIPERWPVFFSEKRMKVSLDEPWQFNYESTAMSTYKPSQEPSVCLTQNMPVNTIHVGYLQISMKMERLFPFLYPKDGSPVRNFLLYKGVPVENAKETAFGVTLSSEQLKKVCSVINADAEKISGTYDFIDKGRHIVIWERVPHREFTVVSDCSIREIYGLMLLSIAVSVIVITIIITSIFLITRLTAGRMLQRLNPLLNGLKEVRTGNMDVCIPVEGNDELSDTAESFNKTVALLKESIEKIKAEQQLVTQTEIRAMQNQINAHFLYNVLETIKMQAELADQNDIVESITVLGKMMRYCLHWKRVRVRLQEELNYVRSYISILNIRNDYQIRLVINVPVEHENCEIPKMIVQPVVENAFVHGIEPRGLDTIIEIFTQRDAVNDKILWLNIRDYGTGMYSEKLKEVRTGLIDPSSEKDQKPHEIGLQNIQQRLFVFYGKEYEMHIDSVPELGTLVRIPVPFKIMPDENL